MRQFVQFTSETLSESMEKLYPRVTEIWKTHVPLKMIDKWWVNSTSLFLYTGRYMSTIVNHHHAMGYDEYNESINSY